MEIAEFSDNFITKFNSHSMVPLFGEPASRQEIVLDEYEKSVFLTEAQNDIVVNLYNGKNAAGDSFESTEEIRRYLAPLVKDATIPPIEGSSGHPIGRNVKFFSLPPDLWFIVYEALNVTDSRCGERALSIVPVTHDEYHRVKDNPFRGPSNMKALRLDLTDEEGDVMVEIICNKNYGSPTYFLRYIRKPKPIILVDLKGTGLTIEGDDQKSEKCELHEALHQAILDRAVLLALQHRAPAAASKDNN